MRQVGNILEPVLTALAADGARLSVGAVDGATLHLRLDTTDACEECVVSDEMLEDIVLGHLRTVGADLPAQIERVEIEHTSSVGTP